MENFTKRVFSIKYEMINYLNSIIDNHKVHTLHLKNKASTYILDGATKNVHSITKNKFIDENGYEYYFDSVDFMQLTYFATNIQSYL